MSAIAWLGILGGGGFIILCVMKMAPAYLEHIYVEEALMHIATSNADMSQVDKNHIQGQLTRYATVNSIGPVAADSFKIKRYRDGFLVNSVYEVRVPIVLNVDVVMSFKSQLDTSRPETCCRFLVEDWDEG